MTLCFLLLVSSCDNRSKTAEALYKEAETKYEQGDYNAAKLLIDSIKTSCPKAFDTRKKSIGLMQRIELAEQDKSMAFLDSLESVELVRLGQIKDEYKYLIDVDYQDVGIFVVPEQDLSRNVNRTMLYATVDDNGVMKLTSILCGSAIDHHVLKVVLNADNTFASTAQSDMFYTSTHLGLVTEKAEFEVGRTDNGVVDFIIANAGKPMTVVCEGKRSVKRQLSRQETNAVVKIKELADVLGHLYTIKEQKKEATNKINFIKARMSESSGGVGSLEVK